MSTPRYEEPSSWGPKPSQKKPPSLITTDQAIEMSEELFGAPNPDAPKLSKMYSEAIYQSMEDFPPPANIEITRDFKRGFNAALQALKTTLALAVSHGLRSRTEGLELDADVALGKRSRKEADTILTNVCQGIEDGLPNESVFGCAVTDNSGHVFLVSNAEPKDLSRLFREAAAKIEASETDIKDIVTGKEWLPGEPWSDNENS